MSRVIGEELNEVNAQDVFALGYLHLKNILNAPFKMINYMHFSIVQDNKNNDSRGPHSYLNHIHYPIKKDSKKNGENTRDKMNFVTACATSRVPSPLIALSIPVSTDTNQIQVLTSRVEDASIIQPTD